MTLSLRAFLLSFVAVAAASAQYGPGGRYGPGSGGGYGPDGDYDGNYGPYGGGQGSPSQSFINSRKKIIVAHGVLAALAFVIFFPVGAIMIRLGSFRGMWLIHGLFQLFAYLVYIAAFGIGVWMVNSIPVNLLDSYHPIIGIVVFVLLFFQPILGFVHHLQYKKYNRRTVWSYGHLWLGRIVITLGMINGGLGLLLASDAPAVTGFAPSQGQIIAYGVIAGIMWLLWAAAAIIGERRRTRSRKDAEGSPPPYKEIYAHRMSDSS
ncbi:Nn.00g008380.m01.CDS01 [Neocucurbitaria sp. VM-36]